MCVHFFFTLSREMHCQYFIPSTERVDASFILSRCHTPGQQCSKTRCICLNKGTFGGIQLRDLKCIFGLQGASCPSQRMSAMQHAEELEEATRQESVNFDHSLPHTPFLCLDLACRDLAECLTKILSVLGYSFATDAECKLAMHRSRSRRRGEIGDCCFRARDRWCVGATPLIGSTVVQSCRVGAVSESLVWVLFSSSRRHQRCGSQVPAAPKL